MDGIVYLIVAIIWCVIWGIATNKVIENKGYYENWFWWGFLFGFIAFIVALTKPNNSAQTSYYSQNSLLKRLEAEKSNMEIGEVKNGSWKCACGEVNQQYMGTCGCGRSFQEVLGIARMNDEKATRATAKAERTAVIDELKQYKELLDIGAITNEEYEIKKNELLSLKSIL